VPAIAIPGGAVHMAVDISGIGAEDLFHLADAFEEVAPVEVGHGAQAGEAVAYDLVVRERMEERRRCRAARGAHLCLSQGPPGHIAGRARQDGEDAPAEHDRQGPYFADGQRLRFLVEGDKAAHALHVEPRIALHHQPLRDVVDARVTAQRTVHQLGQLPVVAAGHVLAYLAQGLLCQVQVIQHPLGCVRERLFALSIAQVGDRCGQEGFPVRDALQQPGFAAAAGLGPALSRGQVGKGLCVC